MSNVRAVRLLACGTAVASGLVFGSGAAEGADPAAISFRKIVLGTAFVAEGAAYGDVDKDGKTDVVIGPYWYAGPDFRTKHEIYPPKEFDPKGYSDNFITFVSDVNGDGWPDVLANVFPGKEVAWFENPKDRKDAGRWTRRIAHPVVDNESPQWGDVTGDGKPELLFHTGGMLGHAGPGDAPNEPWKFVPCSAPGGWGRFQHGLGVGDVNGDGRVDFLLAGGWWEQPAVPSPAVPWTKHEAKFGGGGAQMHVYDVDGDGDGDVITSIQAHGFGLSWFEQVRKDGKISFVEHVVLPMARKKDSDDVQFSQLHAVELADIDGDGLKDIVTGKRYWAHGPGGDAEPGAPAVLYWFRLVRKTDGTVEYVPYKIDDDSGVGTQFAVGDVTGDGRPDIVVGNKKGSFVFLQDGPAKK